MTLKRTAIARTTPLARGGKVKARREGKPRRTRAPIPQPTRDGSAPILDEHQGAPVAFGPQAELCRATMCVACYATRWASWHTRRGRAVPPIDWTQLPAAEPGQRSEAHHEPPMGNAVASDDDDTIGLCRRCHGRKGEPARSFAARHSTRFEHDPDGFYRAVDMRDGYQGARDEMRRRTAAITRTTTP